MPAEQHQSFWEQLLKDHDPDEYEEYRKDPSKYLEKIRQEKEEQDNAHKSRN